MSSVPHKITSKTKLGVNQFPVVSHGPTSPRKLLSLLAREDPVMITIQEQCSTEE